MNNRALTLSIVMAVLAVVFMQSYVSSIEEEGKKKYGTELLVVVAKKDIKEMDTINETMLEFKPVPKRYMEPAAISDEHKEEGPETKKTIKSLAGTVALVPIKKGEQVTFNKLTDPGLRTGLASQIAPGRRAVSMLVGEVTGVAKLVKPGDRVDIIAVMDSGGGKENKIAKTLFQDVVVLSVGRSVTNNVARTIETDAFGGKDRVRSLAEDFSFSSVTLELEPAQAQALVLVMANSDNALTLSLRNNDDLERVNLPSVMLTDVLGADSSRVKGRK